MRKRTNLIAIAFLLLLSTGTVSASIIGDKPPQERTDKLTPEQRAKIQSLERRVLEIKAMDRSSLSKAEKKNIRQELKEMNKEAKAIQGKGVYLSIGAIIIIVLLLILIL